MALFQDTYICKILEMDVGVSGTHIVYYSLTVTNFFSIYALYLFLL